MRALIYTDNHYTQYSSIIRSRGENYSSRLENQIKTLNWLEELAVEKKCDQIICLGDFFDKSELNAEELSALKEIKWSNLKHIFLVGNHEIGSQDSKYNSLNALSAFGEIISEPKMCAGFGYQLIYLPYILESNRKPLLEYLDKLTYDYYNDNFTTMEVKHRIILSHNDICGIRYGQYESKVGFNINDIDKYCDLFINGHLHNQQQITEKILNLGNVTGQNFSEDASKYSHCIAILDTDTLSVDLINNPYAYNFYKLDVKSCTELTNELEHTLSNSVISLKAPTKIINECREILSSYKNISEYRVIAIPELSDKKIEQSELTKLDHISEFKNYILKNIDNNEDVLDELSRL